jgi:hypothetical protein
VRLERAPFFSFSDPIIPLVLLLEIACWIGKTSNPVRSAAYYPEWKLALSKIQAFIRAVVSLSLRRPYGSNPRQRRSSACLLDVLMAPTLAKGGRQILLWTATF